MDDARFGVALLDERGSISAPRLFVGSFVVHAREHVDVLERVGEQLVHEPLLIFQDDGVVALLGRGEEERLFISARDSRDIQQPDRIVRQCN